MPTEAPACTTKTRRNTSNVIALYTGGIQSLQEIAVRKDGVVFQRYQDRDPRFGYRWQAWRRTAEVLGHNERANPPISRSAGFSTLFLEQGEIRRRVPA